MGRTDLHYVEEDNPIAFNPFYTDCGLFDVEKRGKHQDIDPDLVETGGRGTETFGGGGPFRAVNAYIRMISENWVANADFQWLHEFVADDTREWIDVRRIFDIDGFLNVLEPFDKGGDYDFLLNSDKELDLTGNGSSCSSWTTSVATRSLPVVTLIIMETFIAKMRRLKGIRKMILIEECWKALMSANMSEYIKYFFKTVRKYFGEAVVVTCEVDDIISSPIVKEAIINNSDCKNPA